MAKHFLTRRRFLKGTTYGVCAASLASQAQGRPAEGTVPTRMLGNTGVEVSMLGLGGHHIGKIKDDNEAISLVRRAIDMGVTFMDNAWEYHRGRSEEIMGRALSDGYRAKTFLMTKHHGRDKKTAMLHLEDSLRKLRTDVIDLWQFHEIVYHADPEMIFAANGGIEAAYLAKKQGKVRFVGFTGHKDPVIHLKMLAYGFPFDATQMPMSVFDAHFQSFQQHVLPVLLSRNIGVIAMKTLAAGHILRAGAATPEEGLNYVWSQEGVSTIVSGMDTRQFLEGNVKTARAFKPMSKQQQAKLLAKTKEAALTGTFEPFKTTTKFDGRVGKELHGISY